MRVLIVDDSERLRDALTSGLRSSGFVVDSAQDGIAALELLQSYSFDVVVLDIVMPRLDGLGVLREIRRLSLAVRVLVLSARDQVADRVTALDMGADDYLLKPFSFEELRARIDALTRRNAQETSTTLRTAGLEIDLTAKIARCNGTAMLLTPKEFGLLTLLLSRRGQVLSRQKIFDRLYDSSSEASDRVVEVLMSTLRNKLDAAGCETLIQTRRGFGYVVE
jgi:two-component system, OmpR family, response regulator QseB